MSKTNCCNCGAALDIFQPKCQFCGTKNINLTDIDLASGEAANFIFRMPKNITVVDEQGHEMYMSILAVPELTTVEMKSDVVDIYGGFNNVPVASFTAGCTFTMGINLRAVPRGAKEEICRLTIK